MLIVLGNCSFIHFEELRNILLVEYLQPALQLRLKMYSTPPENNFEA
jgi:hypothetical protein